MLHILKPLWLPTSSWSSLAREFTLNLLDWSYSTQRVHLEACSCPSSFFVHKALYLVTQVTIFCLPVCSFSQESYLLLLSRVLCLCISTNLATLLYQLCSSSEQKEVSLSSRHRACYTPKETLKILVPSSHHSIHHSFTPSLLTVIGRWRALPNITTEEPACTTSIFLAYRLCPLSLTHQGNC